MITISLLLSLHVLAFQATISAQQVSSPSAVETATVSQSNTRGVYLYIYRTPEHIHRSSSLVCEEVKDRLLKFLTDHRIELRQIDSYQCSSLPEAQGVAPVAEMAEISQRARAVHASYILLLVLDRPVMAWLKLTLQCFDPSGNALWEEVASNGSAFTGGGGLHSTLKRMEDRLSSRIGQPGLIVEGEPTGSISEQAQAQTNGAGEPSPRPLAAPPGPEQVAPETKLDTTIELPNNTPVRLMLIKPVDSRSARVGDNLELRVLEDVRAADLVVIPRKSTASATVTAIVPPRRKHVPGRITVKIDSVLLINGESAALHGMQTLKSENLKSSIETQEEIGDAIMSTAGLAVFFLPLWALKHGDYVTLPAGMEFDAALDQPIVLERSALEKIQPPREEQRQGPPVITVYHLSGTAGAQPNFYVGRAKVARLQHLTQFQLILAPGTYWFHCDNSKRPVSLALQPGGEYFLRVDSVMTGGNPHNPAFSTFIHLREHDIGELEASQHTSLDPKRIKDVSQIAPALLSAKPK